MSLEAVTCLKKYLAKHSHVILLQVLQTWFHFDLISKDPIEEVLFHILGKRVVIDIILIKFIYIF